MKTKNNGKKMLSEKIKEIKAKEWQGPLLAIILSLMAIILVLSGIIAIALGSTWISPLKVYSVIAQSLTGGRFFQDYSSGAIHDVVWMIRVPRVLLAVVVGGGLAVTGVVMQAVVKNPLADPYILGVSSGASLGATLAILLGIGSIFGSNYIGIVAFIGALFASFLVLLIAEAGQGGGTVKLVLAGMAVSSVFSAFSSFVIFIANDKEGIRDITFWLMGSLSGADQSPIALLYVVIIVGTLFFMSQYRILNLMLWGDETAVTLGSRLTIYRRIYMLIASLMVGFIVYASGMIGFVGLIIPHFARMIFGVNHKRLIPITFLGGGIFMIWADVFARTIIAHTELPIGILVSMIGGPCFVFLLLRRSYGFGGKEK